MLCVYVCVCVNNAIKYNRNILIFEIDIDSFRNKEIELNAERLKIRGREKIENKR